MRLATILMPVPFFLCALAPDASAAVGGAPSPLNLQIAAAAFKLIPAQHFGTALVLATVPEVDQGADLNGDGDSNDTILFLQVGDQPPVNLGLAVDATADEIFALGPRLFFPLDESATGDDYNRDGDSFDRVLHAVSFVGGGGLLQNLRLPVFLCRASEGGALIAVSESADGGADLNGDGDSGDVVVHVLEAAGREVQIRNLQLAVNASYPLLVTEEAVGFAVWESAQGAADLNSDGDAVDSVLHTHRFGEPGSFNSALALHSYSGGLDARGGDFAFAVSEAGQGQDLNGDSDLADRVTHLVSTADGSVFNTGFYNVTSLHFGDGFLAFMTSESSQGQGSLNGDADASDSVLVIVDLPGMTVTPLPYAAQFTWEGSDRGLAFHMSEWTQGMIDIDGDGSNTDNWVMAYDHQTGRVTNVGVKSFFLNLIQASHHGIAAGVNEGRMDLDLNGDGDKADNVAHGYDFDSGLLTNFGIQANAVTASDSLFAWSSNESGQGGTDTNEDGDQAFDNVAYISSTTRLFNSKLAMDVTSSITFPWVELSPGTVLLSCHEADQGDSDLNGDGDTDDDVLHRLDLQQP